MLDRSSVAMSLDVYSDLFDTDVDDVAQRIDEARKPSMGKTWAEGDSVSGGVNAEKRPTRTESVRAGR